jgi:Kef-type K+ transport system membrane component KefB
VPALPDPALASVVLFDLAIILAVTQLVGLLFIRIGQPRVVGEILAGVLLGPTLLGPALGRTLQRRHSCIARASREC